MTWSRVVAAGLEPATSTTYKIGALPAELRNQVDGPRSVEQGSECDPGSGRNRTCEFGPLVSGVRLFRGAGPAGRRGKKRWAAGPRGWRPNVVHLTQLRRPDPADSRSCRGSRRVPFGPVLELSTGPREGHSTTIVVEFDLGLFGSGLLRGGSEARSHAAEALCKACWRSQNSVSVSAQDRHVAQFSS